MRFSVLLALAFTGVTFARPISAPAGEVDSRNLAMGPAIDVASINKREGIDARKPSFGPTIDVASINKREEIDVRGPVIGPAIDVAAIN